MEKTVNLSKASTVCNVFYIFLSAAKASLLPFLTLFFRLIGLSALETGIIISAKTLTGFVWAPLWSRCAVAFNKRRLVLIFSVFMMGAMYLSFVVVFYKIGNLQTCHKPYSVNKNQSVNMFYNKGNSTSSPVSETVLMITSVKPTITVAATVLSASTSKPVHDNLSSSAESDHSEPKQSKRPASPIMTLSSTTTISEETTTAGGENVSPRERRSLDVMFKTFENTFSNFTSSLEEKKLVPFLVSLLIIIFGEFFSSPIEKIADDGWFDFLERIDDMEKYGQQRYWGSFAFAIVPIIVTIIVDFTPCQIMFNLHHFLIHFYVFGIFIVLALTVAFYFPMPPPQKQKYVSKVGKGLRIICCDCRGFLFIISLFLAGMMYASFNNFLFWHLQNMGGQEVTMGLCVSIGAFAETPMLVFSGKLVKKLGNGWVVALALFILSIRLVYYGFLSTPWAVLPAELTNAFTHTALWYAILSYEEFNIGMAIDRSIRSILSSFYFGLGFSAGSIVSGLVFYFYDASVLYWGASAITFLWCIIFSLVQLCLPKKEKVKYIKLLRKEDDSSDGEDDWLEMALKDQ